MGNWTDPGCEYALRFSSSPVCRVLRQQCWWWSLASCASLRMCSLDATSSDFLFGFVLSYVYMCTSVWGHVSVWVQVPWRPEEGARYSPRAGIMVTVSCLMWVPGTEGLLEELWVLLWDISPALFFWLRGPWDPLHFNPCYCPFLVISFVCFPVSCYSKQNVWVWHPESCCFNLWDMRVSLF